MAREETELVVGRGEVFFDLFEPNTRTGTGERYLGNTTTFQVGRTLETLKRFTSYRGQRVEGEASVISESHSVNFITDHIGMENVGSWFGAQSAVETLEATNIITETATAHPGRFIQLGTSIRPFGVRYIENVTVKIGAVVVPAATNYVVESALGRLQILHLAADIETADVLTIDFEWRETVAKVATSKAANLYGALRFISTNPYGPKKHYFFPFVKLTPRGSIDLKGDEWQQIPFAVEVHRLNANTEQVYFEELVSVFYTEDEQAIIDLSGMPIGAFNFYEDELNTLVNVTIPSHNYQD